MSKLLWIVTAPANVFSALLVAGFVLLWHDRLRWGRRLVGTGVILILVCGVLPLGAILQQTLENRFPSAPAMPQTPDGIIVLGGAIDQVIGATRGQVSIVDSATRLTEAVILARRFPQARIVYTGGSNALTQTIGSEAEDAKRLLIAMGVTPERIVIEDQSRNTYENAQFSRDLLSPKPGQRWILVTSAYHMPRSVGLFRAAGFSIIPDPVDFRTTGTWRDWLPYRDVGYGLDRFDFAFREWVGLVAYRLSGKIADVFPAP